MIGTTWKRILILTNYYHVVVLRCSSAWLISSSILQHTGQRPWILHPSTIIGGKRRRRRIAECSYKPVQLTSIDYDNTNHDDDEDSGRKSTTQGRNRGSQIPIPTLYDLDMLDQSGTMPSYGVGSTIMYNGPGVMDVDSQILPYLVSPAPESFYVLQRCIHNLNSCSFRNVCLDPRRVDTNIGPGNSVDNTCLSSETASLDHQIMQHGCLQDLESLARYLVKPGYRLEVLLNHPTEGQGDAGVVWKWNITLQEGEEEDDDDDRDQAVMRIVWLDENELVEKDMCLDCGHCSRPLFQTCSTLEIAHLLTDNDDHGSTAGENLNAMMIVDQLEKRLTLTMGSDLRGITSADAAFHLALGGVQESQHIFDALVKIAIHELKRLGRRSSFQSKYILQMVEKFAASGIDGTQYIHDLYQMAGECLEMKGYADQELISQLMKSCGSFGLHSNRPLLWLWRFSSRQRKVTVSIENTSSAVIDYYNNMNIDWKDYFANVNRGLVVDIGCGLGVCSLNLARKHHIELKSEDLPNINWSECNFAGADLNSNLIDYANGVASRSHPTEQDRLHFFCLSAVDMLSSLDSYVGNIELIMIHFPSPYRLPPLQKIDSKNGNRQLPDADKDGFMISPQVATMVSKILSKHKNGLLVFQTKCEDVAIHVKNLFLSTGSLEPVLCKYPVLDIEQTYVDHGRRPKRVEQWLDSSLPHNAERAEGGCWSSVAIMPAWARPETEIQCEYDNTVVHRCIFRSKVNY